jgi:hypothetical protein
VAGHFANKFCYAALKALVKDMEALKHTLSTYTDGWTKGLFIYLIFRTPSQQSPDMRKEVGTDAENDTSGGTLSMSAEMRSLKLRLKPTKTVVRVGGCVDGNVEKEREKEKERQLQETGSWIDYYSLWELYADLYVLVLSVRSHLHVEFAVLTFRYENLASLSERYGINEYARPRVGDTLIIGMFFFF